VKILKKKLLDGKMLEKYVYSLKNKLKKHLFIEKRFEILLVL
jgi:hypothetical protein